MYVEAHPDRDGVGVQWYHTLVQILLHVMKEYKALSITIIFYPPDEWCIKPSFERIGKTVFFNWFMFEVILEY